MAFPAFKATFKKVPKILGPPARTVKTWCYEKTKQMIVNPLTKKKKTIKDKILKLPLLQKLLIEIVDKINDIIDTMGLIPLLEKRVYDLEKALYELGIRHDDELLQLSDREVAESQRLDAERVKLGERHDDELGELSDRHDDELGELSDREVAESERIDSELRAHEVERRNTMGRPPVHNYKKGGRTRPVPLSKSQRAKLIDDILNNG
tara:strand:- start:19 stop:642 length:624 start_codon:yes stop_codon:yes gene_type:complete